MEVQFGAKPDGYNETDPNTRYANKRAEIWGATREWLKGASIPDEIPGMEIGLCEELAGPTFTFNRQEQILLESKQDMRRRGVASPNLADALACTFAYPVYAAPMRELMFTNKPPDDYNPFTKENIHNDQFA